jgi:DNA-binding response OmpR family regulator
MPGMNGRVLIGEARRRRPGLPALLLTGYADAEGRLGLAGEKDGVTALLRKPVSGDELARRATALLAEKAQAAGLDAHKPRVGSRDLQSDAVGDAARPGGVSGQEPE